MLLIVAGACDAGSSGPADRDAGSETPLDGSNTTSDDGAVSDDIGPVRIPTPPEAAQFGQSLAVSRDGKVLVIGALSVGPLATPDHHRFPVLAYERDGASFSLKCQLPDPESAGADTQGEMLALSHDGGFLAMYQWSGYQGIVLLQRSGGCWARTEFVQELGIDLHGAISNLVINADGTSVGVGLGTDGNSLSPDDPDYHNGGAYVWTAQGERYLRPPQERREARFGSALALSADGRTAFVGEPQFGADDDSYPEGEPARHGSAYVMDVQHEKQPIALHADDWSEGAAFGEAIAASGDGRFVVVGAPQRGAVYLFERSDNGYTQRHLFEAAIGLNFGNQLAISDDGGTVVVGADAAEPGLTSPGAVFVFTHAAGDTWSQRTLGLADFPLAQFGRRFVLDAGGQLLVVGAPGFYETGSDTTGAVFVYAL